MNIAGFIDHTILKAETSIEEVEKICKESVEYGFGAVCIPPPFVKRAKALLSPTEIKIATVVGFPFGYSATESKVAEAVLALVDGADELDAVINLVALRMKDWEYLKKEVALLVEVTHQRKKKLKLIIESGILTDEEIMECCTKLGGLGMDYMKTSTGYASTGATLAAVAIMKEFLPAHVKIKASGGIRDYITAKAFVDAGASRLGCSASVAIAREALGQN